MKKFKKSTGLLWPYLFMLLQQLRIFCPVIQKSAILKSMLPLLFPML